jgi:hypothetical protein
MRGLSLGKLISSFEGIYCCNNHHVKYINRIVPQGDSLTRALDTSIVYVFYSL